MHTLFENTVFSNLQSPPKKAGPNTILKVCTEMLLAISDFIYSLYLKSERVELFFLAGVW